MARSDDGSPAQAKALLADLNRLIEALDRRVPRLERSGEVQIAQDAAELRARASSLIQRIEGHAKGD